MRLGTPTRALLGVITASALIMTANRAQAQGCGGCGSDAAHAGHGSHGGHAAAAQTPAEPIPSVLTHYGKIHASLASDTLEGVAAAAGILAKLVAGDPAKKLPAALAAQADALAKISDLAAARENFKQLSAALINALEAAKVRTGHHCVVYCDMAKGSWLQTDKTVRNPYFGKSMLQCGEVKGAI